MFCHKDDHTYLTICQCEILSNVYLEELPNVMDKAGEHEQEIPYDTIGGCCVYSDAICNPVYGFNSPSLFIPYNIGLCSF